MLLMCKSDHATHLVFSQSQAPSPDWGASMIACSHFLVPFSAPQTKDSFQVSHKKQLGNNFIYRQTSSDKPKAATLALCHTPQSIMGKCKTPLAGWNAEHCIVFWFLLWTRGHFFFLNSTLCLYTIKFMSFKDVDWWALTNYLCNHHHSQGFSELLILFHFSVCLFLWQYHTFLLTIALE